MANNLSVPVDASTAQCNLVTRSQLYNAGLSSHVIKRALSRGEWQEITSQVIKIDTSPLTREQELWAASLHFDNHALTGLAALELQGLEPPYDGRIDLIGPRGGRIEPRLNVVLHTSRRPLELANNLPRRTTDTYSVAHAMAWAVSGEQARFYAYWAVQRRLTSLDAIFGAVFSNPKSHILKLAIPSTLSLRSGIDSVHEHRFLKLCGDFGLPEPIRKPSFETERGGYIHPDFAFQIDNQLLVVEIDGEQHFTEDGKRIDAYRMQVFKESGAEVFRISNRDLDQRTEIAMRQLKFQYDRMARRSHVPVATLSRTSSDAFTYR
jgi:hypothetical protein